MYNLGFIPFRLFSNPLSSCIKVIYLFSILKEGINRQQEGNDENSLQCLISDMV